MESALGRHNAGQADIAHETVCGLLLTAVDSKLLVPLTSIVGHPSPAWKLVTGNLLPGESREQGLQREALEEVGFELVRASIVHAGHHRRTSKMEGQEWHYTHVFVAEVLTSSIPNFKNMVQDDKDLLSNQLVTFQEVHAAVRHGVKIRGLPFVPHHAKMAGFAIEKALSLYPM